ncbi:MAG: hypothetical protein H0X43_01650 [Nitrosospira sp.]|nr:hypothetical protein [Nitrosospira sp.]
MTKNSDEASSEAEYNEILRKLDTLLRKHQGKSSASVTDEADDQGVSSPVSLPEAGLGQVSPTASGNIPTLTETVDFAPATQSPQPDVTSLLGQIVDSALRDTELHLDARVRDKLVQALESRLFGL